MGGWVRRKRRQPKTLTESLNSGGGDPIQKNSENRNKSMNKNNKTNKTNKMNKRIYEILKNDINSFKSDVASKIEVNSAIFEIYDEFFHKIIVNHSIS